MKNIFRILAFSAFSLLLMSCFKVPDTQGFLGDNIYLQGADTMHVAIGQKVATAVAFLDNSTRPCHFKIEKVRKAGSDENVEGFFKEFPTKMWTAPYDYLTDKTLEQVLSKLSDVNMTPLMINEVNGQLRTMESTAQLGIEPGDIFHVDVSITNSKGTRYLEDYTIIKFSEGTEATTSAFVLNDFVNGICITNSQNENTFPFYDQINSSSSGFATDREAIYAGEEVRGMSIKKLSDEPKVGVKIHIKMFDKNGKLFNPETYETYSTTQSYIDHSVNRVNSATDGMVVEFPVTPWPVDTGLYSYIRGAVKTDWEGLDRESLKADNIAGNIPFNAAWPTSDEVKDTNGNVIDHDPGLVDYSGMKSWYVRLRTQVTFYEAGTYEIAVKVPYTTAE